MKKSYFYWKQKNCREVLMLLCLYALKNFLKKPTNFLMAGAVELPAYVIACLGMDKIGRRNTLIPFLIMSAVICGIVMLIPQVSDSYQDLIGSYRNTFDVFNLQCFIRFPILSQNSSLPLCDLKLQNLARAVKLINLLQIVLIMADGL